MSYLQAPGTGTVRPARVWRRWHPAGQTGVLTTVALMRRYAREGARASLTRRTARTIVGSSDGGRAGAEDLRAWIAAHTEFQPDPEATELLRAPELMIRAAQTYGVARGDCDDVAMLAAALSLAAGYGARYVVLDFGWGWEHVYTVTETVDGPVEMDTTAPAQWPAGLRIASLAEWAV